MKKFSIGNSHSNIVLEGVTKDINGDPKIKFSSGEDAAKFYREIAGYFTFAYIDQCGSKSQKAALSRYGDETALERASAKPVVEHADESASITNTH